MAAVQFENFFSTELAAPVAPGDTSISITDAGLLATLITGGNWIYLNLIDANSWQNGLIPPQTYEIVKATAITGTGPYTLTVTRAQDHTTAQSFARCDICAFLLNAQSLYDIASGGGGSGTVTQIDTAAPITGGPITTTGTIGITDFVGSGVGHANGAVPDPGASAGTTHFLREDATWAVPAGGGSVSITATLPVVVAPSPLTGTGVVSVNTMTGDSGSGGLKGAVPAPGAGDAAAGKFLKASGAWAVPGGSGAGSTLQGQEFTTSGTFNVPASVTSVWATMIGGGGGGSTTIAAATGGGGGGAGEFVEQFAVACTGGGTITVTIGAAGTGGASGQVSAQAGGVGGDTSVASGRTYTAKGGLGGSTAGAGGAGGGPGGAVASGTGNPGVTGVLGVAESNTYFGGSSGGGGGSAIGANGGNGGPAGAIYPAGAGSTASSQAGGGGGAASVWGVGGAAGNGGVAGSSATSTNFGSGGGGSGGQATTTLGGGDGCAGYVLIQWVS